MNVLPSVPPAVTQLNSMARTRPLVSEARCQYEGANFLAWGPDERFLVSVLCLGDDARSTHLLSFLGSFTDGLSDESGGCICDRHAGNREMGWVVVVRVEPVTHSSLY